MLLVLLSGGRIRVYTKTTFLYCENGSWMHRPKAQMAEASVIVTELEKQMFALCSLLHRPVQGVGTLDCRADKLTCN